jgi:hypothetical protein
MIGAALALLALGSAQAVAGPDQPANQYRPAMNEQKAQALLKIHQQNPGLGAGVLRHLLADLGDEPVQALIDVHTDIVAHYPNFDAELADWLIQTRQSGQRFRQRFPGLRSFVLERWAQIQDPPPRPGMLLRSRHRSLMLGLALTASHLVDAKYADLPERWHQRPRGMGPAAFLLASYPQFVPDLVAQIKPEQRAELRQALINALTEHESWARRQPPGRLQEGFEALITRFPGIVDGWGQERAQSRQLLLEKFPELRQVAMESLGRRHPDLLRRTSASVDQHYPGLRGQIREVMQR